MSRYYRDPISGSILLISGGYRKSNFVGTMSEWEALSLIEKTQYETADLVDDFNGMPTDSEISSTSENSV